MPDGFDGSQPSAADGIDPDAHGQAALLLIESLLHALLEQNVLALDEALGVVRSAGDVKQEIADEGAEPATTARHSLALIERIGNSLSFDRFASLSS